MDKISETNYEYNVNFNKSINKSPVNVLLGYNGFNRDANLFENSSTQSLVSLTTEERNKIMVLNIVLSCARPIKQEKTKKGGNGISNIQNNNITDDNNSKK